MNIKITAIVMLSISLGIGAQEYVPQTGGTFTGDVKFNRSLSVNSSNNGSSAFKFGNNYGQIYYDAQSLGESNRGIYFQEKLSVQRGFHFLNVNGDNLFKIKGNGNVGIGAKNPNATLQIGDSNNTGSPTAEVEKRRLSIAPVVHSGSDWFFTSRDNNPYANMDIGYGSNKALTLRHDGNVGIGTANPKHKLDINTGAGNLKTYKFGLEHTVNTTTDWARGFRLRNEHDNKTTVFGSLNGNAYISVGFDVLEDPTGWKNQKFTVTSNGNAALRGKLEAKEIKVTNTPTADFVFEDNYNLPSLKSVEEYIKDKKHLPEIASAKEMTENGVNLGNFQIQLLQKIEELTLYTIEQQKQIEELKHQNTKIKDLEILVQKLLKNNN